MCEKRPFSIPVSAQKMQGGDLEGKEAQCRHRDIPGGAWLSCREAATQMCLSQGQKEPCRRPPDLGEEMVS